MVYLSEVNDLMRLENVLLRKREEGEETKEENTIHNESENFNSPSKKLKLIP